MKTLKKFDNYGSGNKILKEQVTVNLSKGYHNLYIAKKDLNILLSDGGGKLFIKKGTILQASGGGTFSSPDRTINISQTIKKINGIDVKGNYDIRKDKENFLEIEYYDVWERTIDVMNLLQKAMKDLSYVESLIKDAVEYGEEIDDIEDDINDYIDDKRGLLDHIILICSKFREHSYI